MATGIAVNDRENGWLKHFFRILGVVALMGGIAMAAYLPDGGLPGILVIGVAVVVLVVNEVRCARQKAARRWVVDTDSGFRWLGGPTDIEVRDSQVVAVRIERTSNVFRRHSPGSPPPFRGLDCRGTRYSGSRPADVHDQSPGGPRR